MATTALVAGDAGTYADVTAGGQDAGSQSIAVTANSGAAGNNLTFAIVETNGTGATPAVTNVGNAYTIHVDDTVRDFDFRDCDSHRRHHGRCFGHDDQHGEL